MGTLCTVGSLSKNIYSSENFRFVRLGLGIFSKNEIYCKIARPPTSRSEQNAWTYASPAGKGSDYQSDVI